MRIRREALDYRVVVRKVGMGSAPFGWDVRYMDALTPVHASSQRFKSMEAAHRDGHAWLADFLSRSIPLPKKEVAKFVRTAPVGRMPASSLCNAPALPPVAIEAMQEDPASALARPELAANQLIGTADPVYPSRIG